ncbi:MAG TPA: hypothetical protein PLI09_27290 [Candidatus Hydrogenedentes bacterium]|nr:hypothetical protein [Candidatus Hydrogenedentota bacterium]
MRGKFIIIEIAVVSQLITAYAAADHVDEYRQRIVNWSQQIHSFKGCYTLRETAHYVPKNPPKGWVADRQLAMECRYQDGNIYLKRVSLHADGAPGKKMMETFYKGIYGYRLERDEKLAEKRIGEVILDAGNVWKWPPNMFLMPHEFFSQPRKDFTLAQALSIGNAYLREQDGDIIFSHWADDLDHSDAMDIYFYPDGQIAHIDYMQRFGVGSPDELKSFWTEEPFAFGVVTERFEFSNYVDVDGVPFPVDVRDTMFKTGNPEVLRLIDEYNNKRLSDQDYMVGMIHAMPREEPSLIREFHLDLATAQVNVPLSPKEFKIEYGPGDHVAASTESSKMTIILSWREYLLQPWLLAAAVVVLTGLIGLGVWLSKTYLR